MKFAKPAIPYSAQLDRLIQRGMIVADRQSALHYLQHINYYRLGAYWLPFEADHSSHQFHPGTRFEDVLNLYVFDRELRLLVLDAIERVEVSVRAQWAYQMAQAYGPHGYLDASLFRSAGWHQSQLGKLTEEVGRSRETFIQHLKNTYDEALPPLWAVVELMSFGQLSKWYANTRRSKDRNHVARELGMDERILTSFLHHLTTVRNLCAHHARLWNRELTFKSTLPNRPQLLADSLTYSDDRRIYHTLTILLYLMNQVNPQHHWHLRLTKLINNHNIDISAMGFPVDWQTRPLWQGVTKQP